MNDSSQILESSQKKVIVGMSGGVDSSVSALLLQEQGYLVEGLFMKNWDEDDNSEYCTAKEDLADAQQVADKLGIKLHQANFASEYWDNVFEHFLSEYQAGRTPNPDILCNKEIKFKVFADYANMLGADFIATGHYARLKEIEGSKLLYKGLDNNKDQSYFLHAVSEEQFKNVIFPIGELEKAKVREIASDNDLITHDKKDSTGICFIGERRFKDFLEQYLPAQPGMICDFNGISLGEHQGLMYYTIGQRQGLGIGGKSDYGEDAWYVAYKDLENNILYVVQGNEHPALFKNTLLCDDIHWIKEVPNLPFKGSAKNRYRQADQDCVLTIDNSSGKYLVNFDQAQRAITEGQYVVFYSGEKCLGGGVITGSKEALEPNPLKGQVQVPS